MQHNSIGRLYPVHTIFVHFCGATIYDFTIMIYTFWGTWDLDDGMELESWWSSRAQHSDILAVPTQDFTLLGARSLRHLLSSKRNVPVVNSTPATQKWFPRLKSLSHTSFSTFVSMGGRPRSSKFLRSGSRVLKSKSFVLSILWRKMAIANSL